MIKRLLGLAPIAGALLLTACATPYTCELGMECLDTHDAYEAARAGAGNKESVISQERRMEAENTPLGKGNDGRLFRNSKTSKATEKGEFNPYSGVKLQDKPVYIPPQPLRIWIAPWVDTQTADGESRLLSGQFMYVTMGGKWTMGEMNRPGRAGDVMFQPWDPKPKSDGRVNPSQLLRD